MKIEVNLSAQTSTFSTKITKAKEWTVNDLEINHLIRLLDKLAKYELPPQTHALYFINFNSLGEGLVVYLEFLESQFDMLSITDKKIKIKASRLPLLIVVLKTIAYFFLKLNYPQEESN